MATRQRTRHFMAACANRRATAIPRYRKALLVDRFDDDAPGAGLGWQRIWTILTTVCHTRLWTDRNAVVFRGADQYGHNGTEQQWEACIRQLRAVAKREDRAAATAIRGATLNACIELLIRQPRGSPLFQGIGHDQPPGTPALISWLRTFQRSCT